MLYGTLPIYFCMLISLIVYIVLINQDIDDDYSDQILTYLGIYVVVIFILMFGGIGIQFYFLNQMRDKVQTAICFINQQLSQEGFNATVVLRKKCPFPTPLNFSHFVIYERTYQ